MEADATASRGSGLARFGRGAAMVLAVVVATALGLHAPPVRQAVLRWVQGRLAGAAPVRLQAERLDYNLLTLSVGLSGVRVAAPGFEVSPFFEADRVTTDLPLRVLGGRLAVTSVRIDAGRLHIVRGMDGRTNLPTSSGGASSADPGPLDVGSLAAPRFRIDAEDQANGWRASLPALSLDIGRARGTIGLGEAGTFDVDGRQTHLTRLSGGVSFDGRAVQLRQLEAVLDEGAVSTSGSVTLLAPAQTVALSFEGRIDAGHAAAWVTDTPVSGVVAVAGRVEGPLDTPAVTASARADRLAWDALNAGEVAARVAYDQGTARIDDLTFVAVGGMFRASGTVPTDDRDADVRASWSNVSLAALARAAAPRSTIRPSGLASGTFVMRGPLADLARWDATAHIQVAPGRTAGADIGVPGATDVRLRGGVWSSTSTHTVGEVLPLVAALSGRLDSTALARSTLAGTAHLTSVDMVPVARLLERLGVGAVADLVQSGQVEATIGVGGRLASPTLDVVLVGTGVSASGLATDRVEVRANTQASSRRIPVEIRSAEVTYAGQTLSAVDVAGTVTGPVIDVVSARATDAGGAGEVTASGQFDTRRSRFTIATELRGWTVHPTVDLPLGAVVEARFDGTGTIDDPNGAGHVRVTDARWDGSPIGEATADVALAARQARVDARVPTFGLVVDGTIGVSAPYPATLRARADDLVIERLPIAWSDADRVTGRVSLAATGTGPLTSWRDGSAQVDVTALEAAVRGLTARLLEPARLRYDRRRVVVDSARVASSGIEARASGALAAFDPAGPDAIEVVADGDLAGLVTAATSAGLLTTRVEQAEGLAHLDLRVGGSLPSLVVSGVLSAGPATAGLPGFPPVTGVTLSARLANDVIDLERASGTYAGAAWQARGGLPIAMFASSGRPSAAPASLELTATGLTPAALEGLVDRATIADLGGVVDLSLSATAPTLALDQLRGTLTLDRFEFQTAGLRVVQRSPTRLVAEGGFARVANWNWTGNGASVTVAGQMRLADRQLALLANADADLRVLTPFVRATGLSTAGQLTARLSVTGTSDEPRVNGDAVVDDGEIRMLDPRVLVTGLAGRAVLAGRTVRVDDLTGIANGGRLQARVQAESDPARGTTARMQLVVDGAALDYPRGLRSELDGDIDVALDGTSGTALAGRVTGTVTVRRASYREQLPLIVGSLAALRNRQARVATAEASPLLSRVALDVHVVTDEDLVVDNNIGRGQLSADLRVQGTAAAPYLAGRAQVSEGSLLFIGRNRYEVVSGDLLFTDPTAIFPELDIRATTRAGGEDIEVALTGPALNPTPTLTSTSTPALGQADITALLLTGRTLDKLMQADASVIGAQVMLGNVSGELLGFSARAVGLDTLRLGGVEDDGRRYPSALASDLDPTSRLTFGKSLGPQFDLTVSQSLRDSAAQTIIAAYRPTRTTEVRVVSNDENFRTYGFRHDLSIGGAMAPRTASRPAAPRLREAPRVASVALTGSLLAPENTVKGVLHLRAGDRFELASWQDDRDRLLDFYRQRSHLAARVTASRADGATGVALTYAVDPGPLTAIRAQGVTLDGADERRLREAWQESVVDDLLVDEARSIVTRAMSARGFVRARVDARLVQDGDTRVLAIEVEPGTVVQGTSIRVDMAEGADTTMASDLVEVLTQRGLVERAVAEPDALVRASADYLRTVGYVDPKVRVSPPTFDGTRADVRVQVDPGVLLRLGRVRFAGMRGVPVADLEMSAALATGAPYEVSALDAARDRLGDLYRRKGFARAAVSHRGDAEAAGLRDVVYEIEEGPRQVVGEVVVAGNLGVRTDVVERALALPTGTALETDVLLRARARVFETGLFRRVDVVTEAAPTSSATELPMRVRVDVEPWPALRLRYGFLASEERSDGTARTVVPGLSAEATRRTILGRNISLVGVGEYQRRQRIARGVLSTPTLGAWPVQSSLVVERSREEFAAATLVTDRAAVAWEQRARPLRRLTLSYAYRLERNHTFDTERVPGDIFAPFDVTVRVARLTGAVAWDSRDDPVDPTRGGLYSSSIEWGPESIGSQIRYVRQVAQAYQFTPWRRMVFASAARLGVAAALGGQELIPSVRFFAGGMRTVRAVGEDSLGPRDFLGDPAGGGAMVVLNHEVRVPVMTHVRGVGFIDAGSVFPHVGDVRFGTLTGAVGGGLRIATPFALLRVDYARVAWGAPPTSGTVKPQTSRWTFGIGHTF